MAIELARTTFTGHHSLAGGRLGEPVGVDAVGDEHVGVVEEPVDGDGEHADVIDDDQVGADEPVDPLATLSSARWRRTSAVSDSSVCQATPRRAPPALGR
jgi:hypothetical protein